MTSQSPHLEVISEQARRKNQALERRRLPRLGLSGEQFRLTQNGKVFSVLDLSEGGMSFRIIEPEDFRLFPVGADIQGLLNLRGSKHAVRAKVRHVARDFVGLEFLGLAEEAAQALESYLDPLHLGAGLKPIPTSEKGATWYRGPSDTDLLFWRTWDGQYRRVALFVLGSFIQWDEEEGLSTGRSELSGEARESCGIVRFETLLLHRDERVDPGKLLIAKNLVLGSNLPQDLKKWCVRHFSE